MKKRSVFQKLFLRWMNAKQIILNAKKGLVFMDYKKIFKSSASRELVLNMLRFVPSKSMLKLQYRIKTGRNLNLKNPERFTEKLQWYKLYYRNAIMHRCVDKLQVRDYIKDKGLEDILVTLYGYYANIEQVDFDSLPEQFVIKTTNGGGGLNVAVVTDKKKFLESEDKTKLIAKPSLKNSGGREWAYYGLEPGIIVEELLVNTEKPEAGVNDYKFFCFNGKVECIVVDIDRYIGHKRNFYDASWNNLDVISDCEATDREIPMPENFELMKQIAEKLSEDFPFVRVDLYNINGKIYFGELTFYPWSGYVQYTPDWFDFELGEKFVLPHRN